MNKERKWTVLLIGGASGMGKSKIAYALGAYYGVNIMEVDDIYQGIHAMTKKEDYPAIHYWESGVNWMDLGEEGNVNWLKNVSQEIMPGVKGIIDNHLEGNVPVIIEGDFLNPDFTVYGNNPQVKALFIIESDKNQILQNYLDREGGEPQHFRAGVSSKHGQWLKETCESLGIRVVESRPWDTLLSRVINELDG